jgi:DNA-directed RNA polymerase sigma subunit (sigma70/sigma32)
MPGQQVTKALSLEQRKQVFLALVEAQDSRMTVPESRKAVAERFGLTDKQVRQIEQEGLDGEWPPLG